MAEDLILDTAIRNWVLIPLSIVMVLIWIVRYFASKMMRSDHVPDIKMVKEGKDSFSPNSRFRAMLQNGIDLSTVDVSYVSSRSWYFLNLLGLRALFSFILGEDNGQRFLNFNNSNFHAFCFLLFCDVKIVCGRFYVFFGHDGELTQVFDFDRPQHMMQMSGFGFDPTRSLGAEKDNIDIVQHEWALPKFEQRAEAVLKKLVS